MLLRMMASAQLAWRSSWLATAAAGAPTAVVVVHVDDRRATAVGRGAQGHNPVGDAARLGTQILAAIELEAVDHVDDQQRDLARCAAFAVGRSIVHECACRNCWT